MGKRGPRPRPTAFKLTRGNPGKRRLNRDEPTPPTGIGDCPAWLDAEGRACWHEHVEQLEAMGVLTRIDRQALTAFCDIWSRYKKAIDFIRKHGEDPILRWISSRVCVATDPAGNIKPVKPDRNRGSKRGDGIVAAIMVIERESLCRRSRSVYESRGMLSI